MGARTLSKPLLGPRVLKFVWRWKLKQVTGPEAKAFHDALQEAHYQALDDRDAFVILNRAREKTEKGYKIYKDPYACVPTLQ